MNEREMFFRYLGLPSLQPLGLEIERAEGVFLYDHSGKQYLDLVSGISVSNTGHRHPEVLKAISRQLEKYLYLSVYGEIIQSPQVLYAEKLTSLLPDQLSSVYFVNSGSEAVEGAMKLAKRYTGRTDVVAFTNAYHGSTQGALSILGHESLKNAFRPLIPGIRFLRFNNTDDLKYITNHTACVFAETIQAEAGIILPDEGYLEKLSERCTSTGTLLVVDDIQMGFGRTGKLFSFEHYGIVPDMIVLAKALGGGLPLGAFITRPEIMKSLTHDPELGHITTFGGNPVCCAAGLASLNVILSENILREVENKGRIIEESIKRDPAIKEIRRKGLMLGVEINDPSLRQKLSGLALENGVIIDWFLFNSSTFRIAPPLTISDDEIKLACEKLNRILSRL